MSREIPLDDFQRGLELASRNVGKGVKETADNDNSITRLNSISNFI